MLQALRSNAGRLPVATAQSIPVPTAGWDAASPLASMKPNRAIILDNFFPQPEWIEWRAGHVLHSALPVEEPVETVMAYHGVTAVSNRLFAVSDGDVYDATAAGEAATITSVTDQANSRFQYVNFATTGTQYLWAANGAEHIAYNGTAWVTPSLTTETGPFINVEVYRNRLWLVKINSLTAGYLPVDSFQGSVTAFPLKGVFSKGGHLRAIGTWTLDAGEGMDDHIVFISSEGQVAVYSGDPASTFSLVGVFNIGAPLGFRCLTKVGGDLAVVTVDGVLPLSQALMQDRAASEKISLTRNIVRAMNDAARSYGTNFGWQFISYPRGTRAILNVPISENGTQHQYVMNTKQGAWCRFIGQNANCWEVFEDQLYFGGNDGKVNRADFGGSDGGEAIVGQCKTAFNYFGNRGVAKHFNMIRPLIESDGVLTPSILVNADFSDETPPIIFEEFTAPGAKWGEVNWGDFLWAARATLSNEWQGCEAVGRCAAVNMIISGSVSASAEWDEADWDAADWDGGSVAPVTLRVNAFDITFEPAKAGNYI